MAGVDVRVVPVGEPELACEQRDCDQAIAAIPRRPRTSGTSGTSQIMNCGESTFPKIDERDDARRRVANEPVALGRAARKGDPERNQRGTAPPWPRSLDRGLPAEVERAVRRHDRRVPEGLDDTAGQRLDLERARAAASRDSTRARRETSDEERHEDRGTDRRAIPAARERARARPRRRSVQTTASGTRTTANSLIVIASAERSPAETVSVRTKAASEPTTNAVGQKSKCVSDERPEQQRRDGHERPSADRGARASVRRRDAQDARRPPSASRSRADSAAGDRRGDEHG